MTRFQRLEWEPGRRVAVFTSRKELETVGETCSEAARAQIPGEGTDGLIWVRDPAAPKASYAFGFSAVGDDAIFCFLRSNLDLSSHGAEQSGHFF